MFVTEGEEGNLGGKTAEPSISSSPPIEATGSNKSLVMSAPESLVHRGLLRRPGFFDSHRPIPGLTHRNGRRRHQEPRCDGNPKGHEASGSHDLPRVAGEITTILKWN